jgi:hypothetical protein
VGPCEGFAMGVGLLQLIGGPGLLCLTSKI